MSYLWIKVLHIIAFISWMAGVLYLYRLLVYHSEDGVKSEDNHQLLCKMEWRLYRYITVPAMLVTWGAGLTMASLNQGILTQGWFHVKMAMVILLTITTIKAGKTHEQFRDRSMPYPSSKSMRIWNEVPTLLMVVIVIMVIIRPWI